jgi:large subunit ribosomal protein L33
MREKVRLISSAKTGYSYYTTKNKQKQTDKIQLRKYDPVARKHVLFTETKMPSHAKK